MQATPFDTNNLLDSVTTVLVVIDNSLRIVYANHAGQALFATGTKQLYGHSIADFFVPNTINKARLRAAFRSGQDFTENEVKLYFRDNRVVSADLTVTNLNTDDGPRLLFEVKKIDQQKRISRENQQHAQHFAARELIRGLAHEIKNPLGGIRGAAQLLEKALSSPDEKEFTQLIIEQSDRLRNLVDRLLGPNSLPRLEWCNLHRPLEKIRSLMKADTSQAIAISRDYDPSIPDVKVDPDMLQQAVLNIVRNAVQALRDSKTPNPHIRLVTRIERQLTIHGQRHSLAAQIKIIDNGPGIPADIRDTLFYPLVTSKDTGSGLGLSIAQTLVNHHDGKIEVDSRPGHTEFIISLPIDRKES
ncbi:two-component system, NtrC family, nitrogen regulation sensor histidine kinase GlnL [Marisediminitalea aggregata]|uniref:Sensory histidine kinase/phosphatase NtrB n=1 Tax=Marisediminitalea aggregata TaxID=634436 RepID=A0A1M5M3N1_9ALTE|nr:nitrogen regulation protein NR(II) [Marisediminitalea aggregata]MAP20454.1 nitrogen regulation protein NR(II) [Alteromonadaceae bacterium]MCP4235930.1 nitrogen regulation protein NR(II) [Aestuariibacter sp.]MEC7468445.1 nitrogen regulation protein NR(II) [Pseudomonadota bacterium]HBY41135.1 nitrogen regulation protein NR(II) [Alteromonas sp.]MCP5011336.1 nitrogen regulation protein NR(II) [Aestuariibacter sp.]